MKFSKNPCDKGDGTFLIELGGGSQEWGFGFVLTTLFYEDPLILPTPTLTHTLPCHFQPPHLLFFLLPCFFGGIGDHYTVDVCVIILNDNMDLHMSSPVA